MSERALFHSAVVATQQGDPAHTAQILEQIVRDDPECAPAWLWLSGLARDHQVQQTCLEHVLALKPDCEPAREGLALLHLREMLDNQAAAPAQPPQQLGVYLLAQGYISAEQLAWALREQQEQEQEQGAHIPLGDLLIQRGLLTVAQLLETLQIQQHAQRTMMPAPLPQRLGEYLVVAGAITPEQLAAALADQAEWQARGSPRLLGELLVERGALSLAALDQMLEQQRADFLQAVGIECAV